MPFGIGTTELLIIGVLAVILFGNRLPSVARSLGKSLTEFKKGMRDFESEMHSTIYSDSSSHVTPNEQLEHRPIEDETTPAEPQTAEPTAAATSAEPQTSEVQS